MGYLPNRYQIITESEDEESSDADDIFEHWMELDDDWDLEDVDSNPDIMTEDER
jgi:hypothetical protein